MKILWVVLSIVIVLVMGTIVIGLIYLGPIVKLGIEDFGPQIVGVPVTVDNVNVSLISGSATIQGLVVANPKGFSNPDAIKIGRMSITLDAFSVTSNKILIHSVRIESPEIIFEGRLKGSNLSKLLSNVNSAPSSASPSTTVAGTSSPPGKPAPKIEIDDFLITNAKVDVGISGMMSKVLPLPEIHLTNLGKGSGGLTPAELTKTILRTLLTDTIELVAQSLGDIKNTLQGLTGSLTSSLGNLLH